MLGGSIGYTVGFFLHPVGIWLLQLTGSDPHEFEHWYRQWGVLLLALPLPYKLLAIASGLFKLPFPLFFGASILLRGMRFFLVAGLIRQLRRADAGVRREAARPGRQRRCAGADRTGGRHPVRVLAATRY